MKADTFAKLVVLETLIDAEIGQFLEQRPNSMELFREGMVTRISDLVDEIDALDAVAAARIYDAIVDFLAALPEEGDGVIDATLRFRRAVDRIVERGMDQRELRDPSTWAVVLHELLDELLREYADAMRPNGQLWPRSYLRAQTLLSRSREAIDRILWGANKPAPGLKDDIDRLTFAVRHQRQPVQAIEFHVRTLQRRTARYRPSSLTRVGAFVLKQVLRRPERRAGEGAVRGTKTADSRAGEPRAAEGT